MPASTQLITNMNSVIATGPSAATLVNANAPAGPIVDYPGMLQSILINLEEAKVKLTALISETDSGDPNLTTLQNVVSSLS